MKRTSLMFRLRRALRSALMLWVFVLGLAGAPATPALAQGGWPIVDGANIATDYGKYFEDLSGFARALELMGTILSVLGNILSVLDTLFGELLGAIDTVLQTLLGGEILQAEINTTVANAMIASDANDALLGVQMDYIMEHAPPKNAHMCRQILIHQLATTTGDYERAVSRIASKAIESMYRGLTESGEPMNGDGPMYFKDDMDRRCYYRYGNPVDGYPANCMDLTTFVGPNRRTFVDADLSPFTMDGTLVLELPTMETFSYEASPGQTVTMTRAAATQSNEQRMWLAGLNYCFQMAGPRPSPPYGRRALDAEESVMWAMFGRGLSLQSAYGMKCTELLAHFTRPSRDATTLIEEQNRLCSSVVGRMGSTNLFDQETIDNQFGGCQRGLSPFQAEFLEQATCKAPQYFMLSANSGVLHKEMMKTAVACGASWNQWQTNQTALQGSLVEAVKGQMKVRKIWTEINASRNAKQGSARATGE